jgi:dihydrodipicolinate synthase/N-acetylneuraminate lyase
MRSDQTMPDEKVARSLPRGIVASSITPFDHDGGVALDKVHLHIDWLIEQGVDGISPLGSSGEFAALEIADRQRVLEAAIQAVGGRTPVLAGTHHYTTAGTVKLSVHAERAGADALLIVPPYYMVPTRTQVMDHYRAVAAAVSIPIVLYHNVINVGMELRPEEILKLHQEGVLTGVKFSHSAAGTIFDLVQGGPDLTVYVGVDSVAFEGLCYGAHGWISGIPSIAPRAARRLYEAIAIAGDLAAARAEWERLLPLVRLEFAGIDQGDDPHWFSVMKAALNLLIGPGVGDPVRPLATVSPEYLQELKNVLHSLGSLE